MPFIHSGVWHRVYLSIERCVVADDMRSKHRRATLVSAALFLLGDDANK